MSRTAWIAAVVALPALLFAYFGIASAVAARFSEGPADPVSHHGDWAYAPFVWSIAVAYYLGVGATSTRFEPAFLLGVPLGIACYGATTVVWWRLAGAIPRRGEYTVPGVLPGLLVAIPEEVLFRDGLAALTETVGPAGFVAVSSAVFGVHHAYFGRREVAFKTGFGVVLSLAFLAAGSVLAPVAIHLGYNLAWGAYVTGAGTRVASATEAD